MTPSDWKKTLFLQHCWICEYNPSYMHGRWLEVQDIERRGLSTVQKHHPCNFFLACNECHASLLENMPHKKQLAYKLKNDPDQYNLDAWLRLRDHDLRSLDRVTTQEVEMELVLIDER